MAYECVGSTLVGMVAGADLSAEQYKLVKVTTNGVEVAGAGELSVGVLQQGETTGNAVSVWGVGSVSKVIAGAAVAQGARVTSDATGRAVTAASGNYIAGVCLTESANADELVTVYITNPGREA